MKHIGVWSLVTALVLLAGCENQELVTCRQDKQLLEVKTASLRQELEQTRATFQKKDAEI